MTVVGFASVFTVLLTVVAALGVFNTVLMLLTGRIRWSSGVLTWARAEWRRWRARMDTSWPAAAARSSGVHTTPGDHAVDLPVPSRVRHKIAK
ncbi:hypothetical protein ACIRQP_36000 [Streptomyces sp. NPDC102274]|uniref:hypothetical protein n=1 Tax=Streptomyces sp. NPDC102274 TaxID=3366151 RepID=UPI00381EB520